MYTVQEWTKVFYPIKYKDVASFQNAIKEIIQTKLCINHRILIHYRFKFVQWRLKIIVRNLLMNDAWYNE